MFKESVFQILYLWSMTCLHSAIWSTSCVRVCCIKISSGFHILHTRRFIILVCLLTLLIYFFQASPYTSFRFLFSCFCFLFSSPSFRFPFSCFPFYNFLLKSKKKSGDFEFFINFVIIKTDYQISLEIKIWHVKQ